MKNFPRQLQDVRFIEITNDGHSFVGRTGFFGGKTHGFVYLGPGGTPRLVPHADVAYWMDFEEWKKFGEGEIKWGDRVTYTPTMDHGITKAVNGDTLFVVYDCGGDWDNYEKYTGANTRRRDIMKGWWNR